MKLRQTRHTIYVSNDKREYEATLEEFAFDFGEPLPELPLDVEEFVYTPGVDERWSLGDEIIRHADMLFERNRVRINLTRGYDVSVRAARPQH